ncbi:MAG: NAD(P)/FAD-dependent oxidoreductase [Pseudomonadales bacterium]|nr:NAD(P)/FAD-dependent oxidoreductase [Pseudomonadales bacterium]
MSKDHFDVVIIGAGLSGIGAGCHFTKKCPGKTFCILEGRDVLGGTWEIFKYPGVRSDSDMFTLGYNFKPWTSSQFLADGPSILNYITEAAAEHGVLEKIRYNSLVKSIEWDSGDATWTITYGDKKSGNTNQITCNVITSCTGYFDYKGGYEPEFDGREDYKGTIVHPQKWPADLDYKDKKVIVVGSGATAVTLLPAMATDTAHITMLQRSPTYMGAVPDTDPTVAITRKLMPELMAYRVSRAQKIALTYGFYYGSRAFPKAIRKLMLGGVKLGVGPDVDMKHFEPYYNVWDERVCAVKSGDLFKAVKDGSASMVTDHIERFTENGILLKSGQELEADIVVLATGLNLQFFGGIKITVDGEIYEPAEKMNYKGIMFEDLPNVGLTFGYTNASWTLKADLSSGFMTRLVNYMDKHNVQKAIPRNDDPSVTKSLFLDFQSGYVQRAIHKFPKMGSKLPWKLVQAYPVDLVMLRYAKLDDGKLKFSKATGKSKVSLKQAS